jgi:hypothetical protein
MFVALKNISIAARSHSPFHLVVVSLLICFSIPMISKRPQDSSAGNVEDLEAATRTRLQAMFKISKRPQGLLRRQS